MTTLAIDLGGSRAKMAVVSGEAMGPVAILPVDHKAPLTQTLTAVAEQGRRLLREAGTSPDAIAMALPGIVHRGRAIASNGKYTEAAAFPWNDWARRVFSADIFLINDAAAALYGEMVHGVAKGTDAVALLMIGTGIGTAAAQQGRVLEGRHGTMGMLGGHIAIDMHRKRVCTCGNIGCLEAWAGTWALDELAHSDPAFPLSTLASRQRVDYRALADGVTQGDALSLRLFDTMSTALGMGAVNLIHAYDPEVLVLSGGPCHIPALCESIRRYARQYAWTPWGQVDIRIALNPEASALWGLHHYAGLRSGQ